MSYTSRCSIPSLTHIILPGSNSVTESLEMMRVALSRLPPAHYNTLRHLLRHLHRSAAINSFDQSGDCIQH